MHDVRGGPVRRHHHHDVTRARGPEPGEWTGTVSCRVHVSGDDGGARGRRRCGPYRYQPAVPGVAGRAIAPGAVDAHRMTGIRTPSRGTERRRGTATTAEVTTAGCAARAGRPVVTVGEGAGAAVVATAVRLPVVSAPVLRSGRLVRRGHPGREGARGEG